MNSDVRAFLLTALAGCVPVVLLMTWLSLVPAGEPVELRAFKYCVDSVSALTEKGHVVNGRCGRLLHPEMAGNE